MTTASIIKEINDFSMTQLVSTYNDHAEKPVKRFADRPTALKRTAQAIADYRKNGGTTATVGKSESTSKKAGPAKKAEKPAKAPKAKAGDDVVRERGIFRRPHESTQAAREGTKTAAVIDLLAEGATLTQLSAALSQKGKPWSPKRSKEWLSWTVNSVKGYGINTKVDKETGVYTYHLTYPEGQRKPVPHTPRKA